MPRALGGTQAQQCFTDADCNRARAGDAACSADGLCVCRLWSPRARFATAAAAGGAVFVAGGLAHVPREACGAYACGEAVARVLNDVWVSTDGRGAAWRQLERAAAWSPRVDAAMAWVLATGAGGAGALWLVGGRCNSTTPLAPPAASPHPAAARCLQLGDMRGAPGLLHLLGWDHPDQASLERMLERQERLLA